MTNTILLFALLLIFLIVQPAKAQNLQPEMITDRPDQTESPYLIPKGAIQIESGSIFERDRDASASVMNVAFKSTLIRYGVNETLELRFISEYLGKYLNNGETLTGRNGFSPITIGAKLKLANQNGAWPQASLISHLKLRAGSRAFSKSYTATSVRVAFSNMINSKWALDYNVGLEWDGESPEAIFLGTISLSYTINGRLSGFVESYSFFPEDGLADNRFDSGLLYKVAPTVQVDVTGGIGLSKNSPDYFLSTGVSFRFFK